MVMWRLQWMTHYPHGQTHWKKYIRPEQPQIKKSWMQNFILPKKSMYAKIKLQNRRYLFRYSRVQTVSMILQKHLSVQAQMLWRKYLKTWMHRISVILSMYLQKQSTRHRSLCSRVDSLPVMSRREVQNSLQLHSVMQKSKNLLKNS